LYWQRKIFKIKLVIPGLEEENGGVPSLKTAVKPILKENNMNKIIGILLLVSLLILFTGVPAVLAETTAKEPWYVFVYGPIAYAVLVVVAGLASGLGKSK
jgi:uncharacterized membrane protein YdcZ (DUF606 family)